MSIDIIGDKNQKGALFESLITEILSKQGYGNFEIRKIRSGIEIDIDATDNVTGNKINVEAKAHEKGISTTELMKFHSKIITGRKKKDVETGIFWSLSGINSHARQWYNDLDSKTKSFFIMKDGNDFKEMLEKFQIIEYETIIVNKSKLLVKRNILDKKLIYFKNQWYFIQFCGIKNKIDSFFVLDSHGNIIDDFICKEIRNGLIGLKKIRIDFTFKS